MTLALTLVLSAAAIFGSIFVHYETVRALAERAKRRLASHRATLFLAIAALVAAHLAEIALFAAAFYVATPDLGTFVNPRSMSFVDYFYYAAETYSSLGYGDIYPLGSIRLLASVTPLVGLLLLGWSSAFLASLAYHEAPPAPPGTGGDSG